MTIFQQPDSSLYVDGDETTTIQRELAKAVEIAELKAQMAGDGGVLVTQHDYWSFTITVSPQVIRGHRAEKRQWLVTS